MKYVPKEITQEVNTTPVHPLVNLAYLAGTVALVGVTIYFLLGIAADQIARRIGPENEEKIGAVLVQAFPVQETVGANENATDSRLEYLHELAISIQTDLEAVTGEPANYPPLKIGILDTPVENAMVMAGSHLFFTEGLLAAVDSENELAFVMAHELGHLQNKDPLTALGRSLVWITIGSLLGLGQQGSGVVPGAFNLAELNYSRGQETAADEYAIALIAQRYTHGDHSLDFFRRAQENELDLGALNRVAEWEQTHPMSGDRIKKLEAILVEEGVALTGEATPLPEDIGCPNFTCEP